MATGQPGESVSNEAVRRLLALPYRQRQAAVLCNLLEMTEDQAAAELSWLDGQITQLRGRMTSQVAGLIRGGLDEQVVKAAVAQLERRDLLALLDVRVTGDRIGRGVPPHGRAARAGDTGGT